MRVVSLLLAFGLAASPALAQQPRQPIREAAEHAASAMGAQQTHSGMGKLFWPGLALGVAGVTVVVLGTTVYRVEDSSTGNAPESAYQACVAQKKDPVYATNNCDGLKAKNLKLLWGGVAMGAAGAVMLIGSVNTSAEFGPGAVRLLHRVRF
jgi:hypothetical protein